MSTTINRRKTEMTSKADRIKSRSCQLARLLEVKSIQMETRDEEGYGMSRETTIGLDLDLCKSPEDAIGVLRRAADKFREDASSLAAAWQDTQAGKFWGRLARDLDRISDKATVYKP